MILDFLRERFLQVPTKMVMSFSLEYTITLNAVFFLCKRGCIQLNNYILLVSPIPIPYRRRTNTQNLTLSQFPAPRYLKGALQLLHPLCPVSDLKGHILILAHMGASGVGDSLSEITGSLYMYSSLFKKVRILICLKVLPINL